MSLGNEFTLLEQELFGGFKAIAVFVVLGKHYFVLDEKENYCIDVRPDYLAYVQQGKLDAGKYDEAIKLFRGGVPVLAEDNFHDYISKTGAEIKPYEWMRRFLFDKLLESEIINFYENIEQYLSVGTVVDFGRVDSLRMRLPSFYINFSRGIYRHTDWGRYHEELALPKEKWDARQGFDFGLLIPDSQQYWLYSGMNFWKLHGV